MTVTRSARFYYLGTYVLTFILCLVPPLTLLIRWANDTNDSCVKISAVDVIFMLIFFQPFVGVLLSRHRKWPRLIWLIIAFVMFITVTIQTLSNILFSDVLYQERGSQVDLAAIYTLVLPILLAISLVYFIIDFFTNKKQQPPGEQ